MRVCYVAHAVSTQPNTGLSIPEASTGAENCEQPAALKEIHDFRRRNRNVADFVVGNEFKLVFGHFEDFSVVRIMINPHTINAPTPGTE